MEKRFYTTEEVAEILRVKPKTLRCYRGKHKIFRSSRRGIWHAAQVRLLIKVWADVLTPDEAYSYWELEKRRMKSSVVPADITQKKARK